MLARNAYQTWLQNELKQKQIYLLDLERKYISSKEENEILKSQIQGLDYVLDLQNIKNESLKNKLSQNEIVLKVKINDIQNQLSSIQTANREENRDNAITIQLLEKHLSQKQTDLERSHMIIEDLLSKTKTGNQTFTTVALNTYLPDSNSLLSMLAESAVNIKYAVDNTQSYNHHETATNCENECNVNNKDQNEDLSYVVLSKQTDEIFTTTNELTEPIIEQLEFSKKRLRSSTKNAEAPQNVKRKRINQIPNTESQSKPFPQHNYKSIQKAQKKVKNTLSYSHVDWNTHYAAMLQYYKQHGHCNVTRSEEFECILSVVGKKENVVYKSNLGSWLHYQKQAMRGNGKCTITKERREKIQILIDEGKLSFVISGEWAKSNWNRHYAALIEYGKKYGTCNIPGKHSFECDLPGIGDQGKVYHYNGKLGEWLHRQREAKRDRHHYKIDSAQVEKLQKLVDKGMLIWKWSARS